MKSRFVCDRNPGRQIVSSRRSRRATLRGANGSMGRRRYGHGLRRQKRVMMKCVNVMHPSGGRSVPPGVPERVHIGKSPRMDRAFSRNTASRGDAAGPASRLASRRGMST